MTTTLEPATTQKPPRSWRTAASCLYEDGDLWYPDSWISDQGKAQAAEAIRICNLCPVLNACRDEILNDEGGKSIDSRHGVRGGLTPQERLAIWRRNTRKPAAAA